MQAPRTRKRFSPAERQNILNAFSQSSLPQRAFATRAGISLSTLSRWIIQSKTGLGLATKSSAAPAAGFIELPFLAGAPPGQSPAYRIILGNGSALELSRGFNFEEASCLFQLLRQP